MTNEERLRQELHEANMKLSAIRILLQYQGKICQDKLKQCLESSCCYETSKTTD